MPKKMPTVAEKPRPIANDHHGSEMGKPVARLMANPMPAPHRMPRIAAHRRQHRGLGQELKQDFLTARAERLAHADLTRPLGDRNHHDRHHADAADHQRDRRDHDQRQEHRAADLIPQPQDGVLPADLEVVRLVELETVADAHDLFDLGDRLIARRSFDRARW